MKSRRVKSKNTLTICQVSWHKKVLSSVTLSFLALCTFGVTNVTGSSAKSDVTGSLDIVQSVTSINEVTVVDSPVYPGERTSPSSSSSPSPSPSSSSSSSVATSIANDSHVTFAPKTPSNASYSVKVTPTREQSGPPVGEKFVTQKNPLNSVGHLLHQADGGEKDANLSESRAKFNCCSWSQLTDGLVNGTISPNSTSSSQSNWTSSSSSSSDSQSRETLSSTMGTTSSTSGLLGRSSVLTSAKPIVRLNVTPQNRELVSSQWPSPSSPSQSSSLPERSDDESVSMEAITDGPLLVMATPSLNDAVDTIQNTRTNILDPQLHSSLSLSHPHQMHHSTSSSPSASATPSPSPSTSSLPSSPLPLPMTSSSVVLPNLPDLTSHRDDDGDDDSTRRITGTGRKHTVKARKGVKEYPSDPHPSKLQVQDGVNEYPPLPVDPLVHQYLLSGLIDSTQDSHLHFLHPPSPSPATAAASQSIDRRVDSREDCIHENKDANSNENRSEMITTPVASSSSTSSSSSPSNIALSTDHETVTPSASIKGPTFISTGSSSSSSSASSSSSTVILTNGNRSTHLPKMASSTVNLTPGESVISQSPLNPLTLEVTPFATRPGQNLGKGYPPESKNSRPSEHLNKSSDQSSSSSLASASLASGRFNLHHRQPEESFTLEKSDMKVDSSSSSPSSSSSSSSSSTFAAATFDSTRDQPAIRLYSRSEYSHTTEQNRTERLFPLKFRIPRGRSIPGRDFTFQLLALSSILPFLLIKHI